MSDAGPVKVLHLTDPHLFADRQGDLRGTVTYESLRTVLEHYRAGDWRADLALVTGDLIQDDSAEAYGRLDLMLLFVFNTWFFLAGVPGDFAALDESREFPRGIRVFAQYILAPLVGVYLLGEPGPSAKWAGVALCFIGLLLVALG